ncbi:hypothetical protein FHG87_014846 [Trinorchestia longiramus]|nr:hypothetical protein FHG87_014846 [Trinorchestia longiramus]
MVSKEPRPQSLGLFYLIHLETRVLANPHTYLESLKVKLQREWEAISQEQIRAACDAVVNRLQAVVHNKEGCSATGLLLRLSKMYGDNFMSEGSIAHTSAKRAVSVLATMWRNKWSRLEIIHEPLSTFQTLGADGWLEQRPLNNGKGLASQLCDCSSNCGRSNPEPPGVLAHGRQGNALNGISRTVSIHNTVSITVSTSDRVDGCTGHPNQIYDLTFLDSRKEVQTPPPVYLIVKPFYSTQQIQNFIFRVKLTGFRIIRGKKGIGVAKQSKFLIKGVFSFFRSTR